MTKVRVGVVFGGRSGEHEVSLRSARAVIDALDPAKYTIVPIAITKQGEWLPPAEAIGLLPAETQRQLESELGNGSQPKVAVMGDASRPGLVAFTRSDRNRRPLLDVIFPVLHGTYGEDGTLQGLLEMAGIAYVGCGVLASSCGMDKVAMKALFREAGLPLCRYVWFSRAEWEGGRELILRRVVREIGYPCFVKPANLGSSVGVSKATNREDLRAAIGLAARYDRKIIVEEGLNAREIECAVIGNEQPEASLPGEYVLLDEKTAFLDYTEKYQDTGRVEFVVPARVPKRLAARIQRMAKQAFTALDGAGLARVDFFLRRDTNELLVNELNTMPGLTEVSGFPKLWAASGHAFPQIIDRLIELAFERYRDKLRNETSL